MAGVAFGSEMRKQQFLMAPEMTPVNHGSWGATPRAVFDARIKYAPTYRLPSTLI